MPESNHVILEERGFFWWLGVPAPTSRYAAPFGVPGFSQSTRVDGRGST